MNPTNVLEHVVRAISKVEPDRHTRWHIVVRKKQIHCQSVAVYSSEDIIVIELTKDDLKKGLTPRLWDRLESKLRTLIKESVL